MSDEEFSSASFLAYLEGNSVKFNRGGELEFKLVVLAEDIEDAIAIRWLVTNPIPIKVHLEVWEPYAEEERADDERLRAL